MVSKDRKSLQKSRIFSGSLRTICFMSYSNFHTIRKCQEKALEYLKIGLKAVKKRLKCIKNGRECLEMQRLN